MQAIRRNPGAWSTFMRLPPIIEQYRESDPNYWITRQRGDNKCQYRAHVARSPTGGSSFGFVCRNYSHNNNNPRANGQAEQAAIDLAPLD